MGAGWRVVLAMRGGEIFLGRGGMGDFSVFAGGFAGSVVFGRGFLVV
jgi:hypothetical protein